MSPWKIKLESQKKKLVWIIFKFVFPIFSFRVEKRWKIKCFVRKKGSVSNTLKFTEMHEKAEARVQTFE